MQEQTDIEILTTKLFVSRDRAAQLLDLSTRTVDDAIRAGNLAAFRVGRRVLIRKDDLIQFAERQAVTSGGL